MNELIFKWSLWVASIVCKSFPLSSLASSFCWYFIWTSLISGSHGIDLQALQYVPGVICWVSVDSISSTIVAAQHNQAGLLISGLVEAHTLSVYWSGLTKYATSWWGVTRWCGIEVISLSLTTYSIHWKVMLLPLNDFSSYPCSLPRADMNGDSPPKGNLGRGL